MNRFRDAREAMRGGERSAEIDAIVNFAGYARQAWIVAKAASLAAGSKILDAGAGECQYRGLFAHCEYQAQDFAQLPPLTLAPPQARSTTTTQGCARFRRRCDA